MMINHSLLWFGSWDIIAYFYWKWWNSGYGKKNYWSGLQCAENLVSTGIRSTERPPFCKSLTDYAIPVRHYFGKKFNKRVLNIQLNGLLCENFIVTELW